MKNIKGTFETCQTSTGKNIECFITPLLGASECFIIPLLSYDSEQEIKKAKIDLWNSTNIEDDDKYIVHVEKDGMVGLACLNINEVSFEV